MYMKRRITPSFQPSLSIDKKYHRKRLATKENMTRSVKKVMFVTEKGAASSVIPKIKVVLMKPLPTIFPKPKAECPPRKAFTVVENALWRAPSPFSYIICIGQQALLSFHFFA